MVVRDTAARGLVRAGGRRGLSLLEALVILALAGLVVLMALTAIPRQREEARFAGCGNQLRRLGVGLGLYAQSVEALPGVPNLPAPEGAESPLSAVLGFLDVPGPGAEGGVGSGAGAGAGSGAVAVAGFVCPSDRLEGREGFRAPISHRAVTGSRIEGRDGIFAPGRRRTWDEVQSGDGAGYTAAFAERALGASDGLGGYRLVPGRLEEGAPCPDAGSGAELETDAGRDWRETSWRSTLMNHALAPNETPSCASSDGVEARMGASSRHVGRVNVLMLDGQLRTVTPTIHPAVWRAMATIDDGGSGD